MHPTVIESFADRVSYFLPFHVRTSIFLGFSFIHPVHLFQKIGNFTKGTIHTLVMVAPLDESMKKTDNPLFGMGFLKVSRFQIRVGIEYENKGTVIEKRESGIEASPLKGKEWIEFPYWIKSIKTGKLLLACSSVLNGNHRTAFCDPSFMEISPDLVKPFLKAKGERPDWFTISFERIVDIT